MGTPLPIEAATIGWADSLILMLLALVVFGPRKLPQLGRQMGKLMYEFRKASNDFKFQMEEELRSAEEADRRRREEAERQAQLALSPATAVEAVPASSLAMEAKAEETNPYSGYTEYVKDQERQLDEDALSAPAIEAPTIPVIEPTTTMQAESQLSYSATPAAPAEAAAPEKSSATEPVQNHG